MSNVCADETTTAGQDGYLQQALQLETSGQGTVSDLKLPNIFEVMMRFFFALLIIVGLLWGSVLVYNKYFSTRYYLGREKEVIQILSHRYLDQKKSIYLIEIAQKILVVGASPEGLQLITEITDSVSIQSIYNLLEIKTDAQGKKDFKKILAGINTHQEREGNEQSPKNPNTFTRGVAGFQSHIKKIKQMINEK
ncbi:MAG: flagellar biosynthetic protein FliO [Candidatus Omnitrophica bacterium]|nr:flagellar biosynthetic protein FliO [Candidatus Omnitrophota bacterium]